MIVGALVAFFAISGIWIGWRWVNSGNLTKLKHLEVTAMAALKPIDPEQQARIDLANQLSKQSQAIFYQGGDSSQTLALLLATQAMQIFPNLQASQVLQNNVPLQPVVHLASDEDVDILSFSPDGRYLVSAGYSKAAQVWDVANGKEIVRMEHDIETIYVATFSPDGKRLLTAGEDHTVRIWEIATAREVSRLNQDIEVYYSAFSPDGKYVASTGGNANIVWEAATGREVSRMAAGGKFISFSPDGKYVLSGADGMTVRLWEAATGKELIQKAYHDFINFAVFSPDGKYVLSGGGCDQQDTAHPGICTLSSAQIWETATGREISRLIQGAEIYSVAFSPDRKYIVSGSRGYEWRPAKSSPAQIDPQKPDFTARVWDVATGKEIARLTHDSNLLSVAFSSDGKYVASTDEISAWVWEATTGKVLVRLHKDRDTARVAIFSPDGKYLAVGGASGVRIWKMENLIPKLQNKTIMLHDGSVASAIFSADGKYVISRGSDYTVRVWDVSSGKEIARMTHESAVSSLALSPDGKYIISGSWDYTARVWEVTTGKEIAHMLHDGRVYCVAFSPDGKYVASGSGMNDRSGSYGSSLAARVWEVATGRDISRMTHGDEVHSVAFSPDGKYAVSADMLAKVWEVTTGKEISRMQHGDYVDSIFFTPNGKYIISSADGITRVWEAATGYEIAHIPAGREIFLSPNGQYMASSVYSGNFPEILVWEVATGKEITRIELTDVVITTFGTVPYSFNASLAAFSPDGKYIVSISPDPNTYVWGIVFVWDVATGKVVARLRLSEEDDLTSVAFSPDGKYLVSGGDDHSVRLWLWRTEDLSAEACSRVTRNLTRAEWQQYIGDALPYQAVCPNLPIEPEPTPPP